MPPGYLKLLENLMNKTWIREKQTFVRVALLQDVNESQKPLLNDEANFTTKTIGCG